MPASVVAPGFVQEPRFAETAQAAVFGIGNVLMGDDGFGPYVARVLEASCSFPPSVTVADLGTPGPDLLTYLDGLDLAVLVDTVNAMGRPGDVRVYTRDDLLRHPPGTRVGPHDSHLKEALLHSAFSGGGPDEVLLVGAIPHRVRTGPGLSPAVRSAVPLAAHLVIQALADRGWPVAFRRHAPPADIWWEPQRPARPLPRTA
ncbi:MAG TPA: hydrogenase maturation protease [Vicinamibacteria bacterium]|jgi:hydrogenase maturation protease